MKTILIFLTCLLPVFSFGADQKITREIYIRSADPLLIAKILAGTQNWNDSPEPTSLIRMGSNTGFGGSGGFNSGNFGGGGFGNRVIKPLLNYGTNCRYCQTNGCNSQY